jgi:drug/metabolite transporter (DMT)-like permease
VELWVPITIVAAFSQCVRTALQQKLKSLMSVNAAGFVRYLYGAPLSIAAVVALITLFGRELPTPNFRFLWLITLGGVAQIIATILLIYAFQLRNYAVGTIYAKTEVVQVALFSTLFLDEPLAFVAWVGIFVSLVGVIVLSVKGDARGVRAFLSAFKEKAALVGITAGGIFGIAAVSIRLASNSLPASDFPSGDFMIRGLFTLAVMNSIQTVLNGAWLLARERDQLKAVFVHWRSSALVGFFSVLGSAGWALAMTLENAAHVRAVGQIELIFTFVASRLMLGEKPTLGEAIGGALVIGGVVVILLSPAA